MKKKSHYYIIFVIAFTFILSLTLNAHATNGSDLQSLQQVMGIQPDGDYAKVDLATTPEGSVIMATVEDPSKIGGCLKGDRVELTNLGNGEWKITRLANGSGFYFTGHKEDGVMKITKTETFGQKVAKPTSYRQYGKSLNYLTLKAGIYEPETDDLDEFDTGFNGEISIGHYFNPNFAMEFGVGYFKTDTDGVGVFLITPYLFIIPYDVAIDVIPITLTFKGILPFEQGEIFAGLGVGGYYVDGEVDVSSINLEDEDFIFGAHVVLGAQADITKTVFIGVEGKYFWTDDAELKDEYAGIPFEAEFELDGFTVTANLGFRF